MKTKPARYRPPRHLEYLLIRGGWESDADIAARWAPSNSSPMDDLRAMTETFRAASRAPAPSDRCGTVAPGDFDGMDHRLDAVPYLARGRR